MRIYPSSVNIKRFSLRGIAATPQGLGGLHVLLHGGVLALQPIDFIDENWSDFHHNQGSVLEPKDLSRFVEEVLARWGRIDAVVNHTGHPPKGDLLEISAEDWQRGHDMVLAPVIEMARLVTPTMLKQGTGAFVNITTFAAYEPSLIFPVSCTYRAAVGAFTRLYADRYAAQGLRMNAVLPGFTDSLNHKPETVASIPMKRVAAVSEIAKSVAFLLSEDASYITGQSLRVDGGITRGL